MLFHMYMYMYKCIAHPIKRETFRKLIRFFCFTGLCVFLSVSIFAAKREDLLGENFSLHIAFAFCVIGMILAAVAGFVFIRELKRDM